MIVSTNNYKQTLVIQEKQCGRFIPLQIKCQGKPLLFKVVTVSDKMKDVSQYF